MDHPDDHHSKVDRPGFQSQPRSRGRLVDQVDGRWKLWNNINEIVMRSHALVNYLDVLLAGDHGHARGQIACGAVRGRAHARLVVVEGVILLHDLLCRRQRDLDGSLDHRNRPLLNV